MTRLPFELLLALRYLRPKRTFVSFITLISIVGVTLGVAVLIVVIAVMSGFDKEWHDRILGFNAHMRIEKVDGSPISDYSVVIAKIRENTHVIGVSPYIEDQALVETQPRFEEPQAVAPLVRGIDPETEGEISNLPQSIVSGAMDLSDEGVLVGVGFAGRLGIQVGDRLAVYSRRELRVLREARGKENPEIPIPDDYIVRGIFNVDFAEYNHMWLFTSIESAQVMNDWDDEVQGLAVKLDDLHITFEVKAELQEKLGEEFVLTPWQIQHNEIFNALQTEKNMIRYLLFFIVLVAAFGITSSLITFVVQKTREIGALRSMGASSIQVLSIFLIQCVIVGAFGVSIGFGMGMLALRYRNEFLTFLNNTLNTQLLPPSIYQVSELPALILPSDVISICGFSLLICLISGIIPALIAARLKPVEALRHD
ncbi:MAG: ABC transporter permease [Verrucomicrobiia bacterium]|jgi:lipoprotein-releasing system permease protein